MSDPYNVTLHVAVTDEKELWEHARSHFVEENAPRLVTNEELDEIFFDGTGDDPYDISACLRQIFDPGVSPPGVEIHDSSVE